MPRRTPGPAALLVQAAEGRAAGLSWDEIATRVGRSPDTVRRWPRVYRRAWARAVREAEAQLLTQATAESVHTLRKQLRSEDEKASREAAQKLIQFRVAVSKKKPARKAKSGSVATQYAALEGLSDEQLRSLAEEALAAELARRAPPAGAEGADRTDLA